MEKHTHLLQKCVMLITLDLKHIIDVLMYSIGVLKKHLLPQSKKNGGQYCYDHNGRRFKSESLMCQYWGIDRKTYKYRRSKGLSIEESLTQELSQGKALKKPIE